MNSWELVAPKNVLICSMKYGCVSVSPGNSMGLRRCGLELFAVELSVITHFYLVLGASVANCVTWGSDAALVGLSNLLQS